MGVLVPFLATLLVGMFVAGATKVAFGSAVWQLPTIFGYWHPVLSVLGALVLAIGTMVVNILANIPSPINDIMNLAPKRFTHRGCGIFVLLLSFAVCPWWTFSGEVSFVFSLSRRLRHGHRCHRWCLPLRLLDRQGAVSGSGGALFIYRHQMAPSRGLWLLALPPAFQDSWMPPWPPTMKAM